MTLHQLTAHLHTQAALRFRLPDGRHVAAHAHLTEAGVVTRHFIDCGGTARTTRYCSLQLWSADDLDHRLTASKALDILTSTVARLGIADDDLEVHVEFQGPDTIARYGLAVGPDALHLVGLATACLALDRCGVPTPEATPTPTFVVADTTCVPGGGCC